MYISEAQDMDASWAPLLSFPFVLMHGLSIVISYFLKKKFKKKEHTYVGCLSSPLLLLLLLLPIRW